MPNYGLKQAFLKRRDFTDKGFEMFHEIRELLTPTEELDLLHLLFRMAGLTQMEAESPRLFGNRVCILAIECSEAEFNIPEYLLVWLYLCGLDMKRFYKYYPEFLSGIRDTDKTLQDVVKRTQEWYDCTGHGLAFTNVTINLNLLPNNYSCM